MQIVAEIPPLGWLIIILPVVVLLVLFIRSANMAHHDVDIDDQDGPEL